MVFDSGFPSNIIRHHYFLTLRIEYLITDCTQTLSLHSRGPLKMISPSHGPLKMIPPSHGPLKMIPPSHGPLKMIPLSRGPLKMIVRVMVL